MSCGTAQTFCPDCGKWYNTDCGHKCPSPGAGIGFKLTRDSSLELLQREFLEAHNEWVETVVEWILKEIDDTDVPSDEGNSDALKYNLVHLVRDGKDYVRYQYLPVQDDEIESWNLQ